MLSTEIAVHQDAPGGSTAPGAAWALTARPGDEVAFVDGGCTYAPTPAATWQLLVGDESALPAILAILERSSCTLPAEVFLEVPLWRTTQNCVRSIGMLPRPPGRDGHTCSGVSYKSLRK